MKNERIMKYDCTLDGIRYTVDRTQGKELALYEQVNAAQWRHIPSGRIVEGCELFTDPEEWESVCVLLVSKIKEEE